MVDEQHPDESQDEPAAADPGRDADNRDAENRATDNRDADNRAATEHAAADDGATTVLPGYRESVSATRPIEIPRWSARAEVRKAAPDPGPSTAEWSEDPYGGRSWFTPVIVGGVALALLAALVTGVLLIYRATQNGESPPPVTSVPATVTATSAAPSPTPAATSAVPSVPAPVPVPNVVGLTEAAARQQLLSLGLAVAVTNRQDATATAGTVLETSPAVGSFLEPGSQVTLVVAVAPPPSVPASVAPSGG